MGQKNNQIKNENLIYIKLGYQEALQSKKDVLLSEMEILKISKIIKKYHFLRLKELKLKLKLSKRIKETNMNIKRLQANLPKIKLPEILRKDSEEEDNLEEEIEKTKEMQYDENLELQLKQIQEKLNSLQK